MKDQLDELRERMQQVEPRPPTESEAARFLRGCGGNTDKAQHTLTKMLAWRAEMGVDGIKSAPENAARELKVLKYMTYYTGLTDRNQQPVAVWRTGGIRSRQLMQNVGGDEIIHHHIVLKETVLEMSRQSGTGGGAESHAIICDMEGLGLHVADYEAMHTLRRGIEIEQRYYPETIDHIWITRPPWIFSAVYNMVWPWLDDYAKSKITVLGDDFTEHLLAHMHESQLPEFLGGTFRSELEEAKAESALEQNQNIAAGSLFNTEVKVMIPGIKVSWCWRTLSEQDLSFELRLKPVDGGQERVIIPASTNEENGEPVFLCGGFRIVRHQQFSVVSESKACLHFVVRCRCSLAGAWALSVDEAGSVGARVVQRTLVGHFQRPSLHGRNCRTERRGARARVTLRELMRCALNQHVVRIAYFRNVLWSHFRLALIFVNTRNR